MILKVIASLIFFYMCVYISNGEKYKLKYKFEYLTGIINALNYLKKEIVFFSSYLGDAFIHASQYAGIAENLFKNSGIYLLNDSSPVLDEILVENLQIEDLRIKNILKELGSQIGASDTENEEILIENTIMKLSEILEDYKKDYYEKGKLIGRIGIIAGIFVAILIL